MPSKNAMSTTSESLYYLAENPKYQTEKPYFITIPVGETRKDEQSNIAQVRHDDIQVTDIRGYQSDFTIDKLGFELVNHETKMSYEDFTDHTLVISTYYREVEALLQQKLGASRVFIFDHTLRQGVRDPNDIRKYREPALGAHIDQTPKSCKARILRQLPNEAPSLCAKRYQVINVWRPIIGPCNEFPLAFCDYRTLDLEHDLVATDYVFPEYTGESYNLRYNPKHQWYFASDQAVNEAWVFKCADTLIEDGVARMAGHTAFNYSRTLPDARPRESIEVRSLVFYD